MFGEDDLIRLHRKRSGMVSLVITVCFGVIFLRLWYLQVYRGEQLHSYSLRNRLRKEAVPAPRGLVYDRDGKLVVFNVPRLDAVLTPQFLQDREKTILRLSKILQMSPGVIKKILKKKSHQAKYLPIIVKKNTSMEEVARLETEGERLPGVSVETFISREYSGGENGAHLFGYISEISQSQLPKYRERDGKDYRLGDFIGQFGLEEQSDQLLRGENGHEFVEVDAFGRKRKYINTDNIFKGIPEVKPIAGHGLHLTIDSDLQTEAANQLKDKVGSLVAVDVNTGEVLAMVSSPSFDPSQFSRGLSPEYWKQLISNKENPLRDRTLQEHYPPGSTFKPFTAIAALERGILRPNQKHRCHGTFKLGQRVYHSWKRYDRSIVDVAGALKKSCNVFFWKVATELDIDDLASYARLFGFGEKTGIGLPREIPGLVPTKEWKLERTGIEWQLGETLSCAVGQSYTLTTIMQLAMAYATLGNRGKLMRPYLIKRVENSEGKVVSEFGPELVREIKLKESTWNAVHKGLYDVANHPQGTAWWRRGKGLQMAGKTGTAQVVRFSAEKIYSKCKELDFDLRHHGLYAAYLPADNPRIAIAVIVEHGCGGSSSAAPVVAKVGEAYMKKYLPEEYKKNSEKEYAQYRRYLVAQRKAKEKAEAKKAEEDAQGAD